MSIDEDDYFGQMIATTWRHLSTRGKSRDSSLLLGCCSLRCCCSCCCFACVLRACCACSPASDRRLSLAGPDGSKIRAIQYVPRADVDRLEEEIKKSIYSKKAVTNSQRVVEKAFRVLGARASHIRLRTAAVAPRLCSHLLLTPRADKDKSGSVSLEEFINAMEGFGMQVQGVRPGAGGLPLATVKALFNSYDADHSGSITYAEFCG